MVSIDNDMRKLIEEYITLDNPFGPIDARDIISHDVLKYLFEQHNIMYKSLLHRPSIIMGRRGSGKTSYLRTVYFDGEYDYFIDINTANLLQRVVKVVQDITQGVWFAESVSDLWETIIWIAVFSEIRKHMDDPTLINAYLAKVNVRHANTIDDVFWKVADTLSARAKEKPIGIVAELLRQFDNVSYAQAQDAAIDFLTKHKKKLVVLMDSLDNFRIDIQDVSRSLEGLLKFVGSMNKPREVVDIRFCLPAELYHKFLHISSNPLKDFRKTLSLQWIATELILLSAQRLRIFLELYYPTHFQEIKSLDATRRHGALEILSSVWPKQITNRTGHEEHTISYMLRHTQLLPRQYLMILNNIFRRAIRLNHNQEFHVSERHILDGIRETERIIVEETMSAHESLYPNVRAVCERCLPELHHTFTQGELQRNFRRHGKSVMGGNDFYEFRRMLTQIGCIGRKVGEPTPSSPGYIKGLFEYTVSRGLTVSTDDILCLHPLFSGVYGRIEDARSVYPYGTILDENYRDAGNW